jgi:hypothetical protein
MSAARRRHSARIGVPVYAQGETGAWRRRTYYAEIYPQRMRRAAEHLAQFAAAIESRALRCESGHARQLNDIDLLIEEELRHFCAWLDQLWHDARRRADRPL